MTKCTFMTARGRMGWRAWKGIRMNMGNPNVLFFARRVAEGGGYARSTDDTLGQHNLRVGKEHYLYNNFR